MMLLVVDKRKRVSLGALARHGQYIAQGHPDGTITLIPARVVTEDNYLEVLRYAEMGREAERAKFDEPPF